MAFVKAKEVDSLVEMFAEWCQLGNPEEKPFFLTKVVLAYLMHGDSSSARGFIDAICPLDHKKKSWTQESTHPLENFVHLLVESVEKRSVILFQTVCLAYKAVLQVDPAFISNLEQIGHVCLGMPTPKPQGGLLGNLMSLLK